MPRPPTGIVAGDPGHILHHNQIHGTAAFQDTVNDFTEDQRFASGRPWVDVTAAPYGADPTGTLDSKAAIDAAATVAATLGAVLYFPPGQYRIATAGNGIEFDAVENVTVLFAPGARLVMDNLDGAGEGTGHGVLFTGRCDRVQVIGARIVWDPAPSARSLGDGFRFLGFPSDGGDRIKDVQLLDCTAVSTPQTGAIFMGCSDVRVHNFRAELTEGDGLHFNACRRVNVDGVIGQETGDDTLAFVTYYDPVTVPQSPQGPFNQPSLGDWSNRMSAATNIVAHGGAANGVRIEGSLDVAVSNVAVAGKPLDGVIVDSAGGPTPSQAPRGITVSNVVADGCGNGVEVVNTNTTITSGDENFWRAQVRVEGVEARGCTNAAVRVFQMAGVDVVGVQANACQALQAYGVRDFFCDNIVGVSTPSANAVEITGEPAAVSTLTFPAFHNINVGTMKVADAPILLTDIWGLQVGSLRSVGSSINGVVLLRVKEVQVDQLWVRNWNTSASGSEKRGLMLQKVQQGQFGFCKFYHDLGGTPTAFEIGGGDADALAAQDLFLHRVELFDGAGQPAAFVVQGGPFAPIRFYWAAMYFIFPGPWANSVNDQTGAAPTGW